MLELISIIIIRLSDFSLYAILVISLFWICIAILFYIDNRNLKLNGETFWNIITGTVAILSIIIPLIIIIFCYLLNIVVYAISTAVSVFAALITLLGALYSIFKAEKNNLREIELGRDIKYVELRFNDAKEAIYDLKRYFEDTTDIYYQLRGVFFKDFNNIFNHQGFFEKITPRAFFIIQITNILCNFNLMSNLPLGIRLIFENYLDIDFDKKMELIGSDDWKESRDILRFLSMEFDYEDYGSSKYFHYLKEFNSNMNSSLNNESNFSYLYCYYTDDAFFFKEFDRIYEKISNEYLEDLLLEGKKEWETKKKNKF